MASIIQALDAIDPSTLDYDEWLHVGMGLKEASADYPEITWLDWDEWSARDTARYKPGDCEKRWNSFRSEGITRSTVFSLAYQSGFTLDFDRTLDFDTDSVEYDGVGEAGLVLYLKTLFKPDDIVSYVTKSRYDEKRDKYQPIGNGLSRQAKDIIADLEKYRNDTDEALGAYDHRAGAWIRFNPMDGEGVTNNNVAAYRYALVEADDIPVNEQYKKIIELKLPCAAIVYSGKRSLHAIVRIDAKDYEEYRDRVRWLYKTLEEHGFNVDQNNKNPSRMSRIPGFLRGDSIQSLVEVNTGLKSFMAFKEYIERGDEALDLPPVKSIGQMIEEDLPLAEELIHGVLRRGHKMLLSGPSKAGKSFILIELASAFTTAENWIGFECEKAKVLYINLEIDEPSFKERLKKVYQARGVDLDKTDLESLGLDVWNLRGHAAPLGKLVGPIIERSEGKNYDVIIIDPIYKVQSGDENAAGDIAHFTNALDQIANGTGAAVIYCHHHSKGAQGHKKSMDRASGSGVFARDADGLIDLLELVDEDLQEMDKFQNCTFWRVEGTLREFAPFKPFNIVYQYPVHKKDTSGILNRAEIAESAVLRHGEHRKLTREQEFELAFDKYSDWDTNTAREDDIAAEMGAESFEKIKHIMSRINKKLETEMYVRKDGRVRKISKLNVANTAT